MLGMSWGYSETTNIFSNWQMTLHIIRKGIICITNYGKVKMTFFRRNSQDVRRHLSKIPVVDKKNVAHSTALLLQCCAYLLLHEKLTLDVVF